MGSSTAGGWTGWDVDETGQGALSELVPLDIEEFKFVLELASGAALMRTPLPNHGPGGLDLTDGPDGQGHNIEFEDEQVNRAARAIANHFGYDEARKVVSALSRMLALQALLDLDCMQPFFCETGNPGGEIAIQEVVLEAAAVAPLDDLMRFDEHIFLAEVAKRKGA